MGKNVWKTANRDWKLRKTIGLVDSRGKLNLKELDSMSRFFRTKKSQKEYKDLIKELHGKK